MTRKLLSLAAVVVAALSIAMSSAEAPEQLLLRPEVQESEVLQAAELLPDELRLELWLKLWKLLPVELQHLLCAAPDVLRSGSDLLRSDPLVWHSGSRRGSSRAGQCSRTGSQRLISSIPVPV